MTLLRGTVGCVAILVVVFALRAIDVAEPNAIDHSLPVLGVLVSILALLCRERRGGVAIAGFVPLLGVAALFTTAVSERMFIYGGLFAVALGVAILLLTSDGAIPFRDGMVVAGVAVAAVHCLPIESSSLLPDLVLLAEVALLSLAFSRRGRITPAQLTIVFALAVITPSGWGRPLLFPLVVALVLFAVRIRSWRLFAAGGIAALFAGKWALPIAGIPLLVRGSAFSIESGSFRIESGSPLLVPFSLARLRSGATAGLGTVARLAPLFVLVLAHRPRGAMLATAAPLLILASLVRPAVAQIYIVVAIALLLVPDGEKKEHDLPSVLGPMLLAVAALAWGGSVTALFPLPLGSLQMLALGGLLVSPFFGLRFPALAGVAVAGSCALAALLITPHSRLLETGQALAPGGEITLPLEGGSRSFSVAMSLSNGNDLAAAAGGDVAAIELIDARGRAWRRMVQREELADWGAFRRGTFFRSRDPLPAGASGGVVGSGRDAYRAGWTTIVVEGPVPMLRARIRARGDLPASVRINIEAIGGERR